MNCLVSWEPDDFADLEREQARERYIRSVACLGLNEKICGIEVKPLTSWHVSHLRIVGSPFLTKLDCDQLIELRGPALFADVMLFLWIVSPMFEPGSRAYEMTRWDKFIYRGKTPEHKKTARDRFNEAFAPVLGPDVSIKKIVGEIIEYIDEAFIDAEEPDDTEAHKSFYSEEVSVAYELSKTGFFRLDFWNSDCLPAENPLKVPLKIVFQLRRARLQFEGKGESMKNRSDRILPLILSVITERENLKRRLSDPQGVNAIYGIYRN